MVPITVSDPSRLLEIRSRLELLANNLPSTVDARNVSAIAKIPFKAMCCREGFIWRVEELGRCACESFERGNAVVAVLLSRSLTETACALWYLKEIIERQCTIGIEPDLDTRLMALLLGHRNDTAFPAAPQILTLVDRADKSFPGLRTKYDAMSEFSHPNYAGSAGVFSKPNAQTFQVGFGKTLRDRSYPNSLSLDALLGSLLMVEIAYNKIGDLMPSFIKLCEAAIAAQSLEKRDI